MATAVLALGAGDARAERRTTVTLGAVFGAQSQHHDDLPHDGPAGEAEGFGGPRLMLAWAPPPLPYPPLPGYAVDTGLVPELIAGAFLSERLIDAMIGVGLRAELRVSQKQQGLLRVSMRAVFYAAGRALVVGDRRDFFGELVLGEYILLGRTARLGFELGGMRRDTDGVSGARTGIVGQLYLGWQL